MALFAMISIASLSLTPAVASQSLCHVDIKATGDAHGCVAVAGAGTATGGIAIVGAGSSEGSNICVTGTGSVGPCGLGVLGNGCKNDAHWTVEVVPQSCPASTRSAHEFPTCGVGRDRPEMSWHAYWWADKSSEPVLRIDMCDWIVHPTSASEDGPSNSCPALG